MTILIVRTVHYRGGLKVLKGEAHNAEKTSCGNYSIPHPRFTDPKIRAHVPATHAREV